MRILILGQPRSGTTTLVNALGKALKYKSIHEPYKQGYYKISNDFCIIKTLINQPTPNVRDFDNIILLARKDDKLAGESMQYAEATGIFNDTYSLPKNIDYRNKQRRAWELRQRIELVSNIINIPVTWYEDLYSGDTEIIYKLVSDIWGLKLLDIDYPLLYKELNPTNKFRKD
jgi:hypothetical protein